MMSIIGREAPTFNNKDALLRTQGVGVTYGTKNALHDVSLNFAAGTVTALIGPSGCGKSTFLRCLNLMNYEIPGTTIQGEITYKSINVLDLKNSSASSTQGNFDLFELRKQIGMVFQQPNPFRKSIYENIAFALRRHGFTHKSELDAKVEDALTKAALWDEVKDKLNASAYALSGGQQQRLCIARTLALDPKIILMDEPCSALDPIATFALEETMSALADRGICIITVTHNMEQAARVSHYCAFFLMGQMIEFAPTAELFSMPKDRRTNDYLTGRFG